MSAGGSASSRADDGRELGRRPRDRSHDHRQGRLLRPLGHRGLPAAADGGEEGAKKKKMPPSLAPASLFKTVTPSPEDALSLSLPREVGTGPGPGEVITAQNGHGSLPEEASLTRARWPPRTSYTITPGRGPGHAAQDARLRHGSAQMLQGNWRGPDLGQEGSLTAASALRDGRRDQRRGAARRDVEDLTGRACPRAWRISAPRAPPPSARARRPRRRRRPRSRAKKHREEDGHQEGQRRRRTAGSARSVHHLRRYWGSPQSSRYDWSESRGREVVTREPSCARRSVAQ